MNELIVNTCHECGSVRFAEFSSLDFEQQLVAQRKAGEAFQDVKRDQVKVCQRCYAPSSLTETRV